MSVVATGAMIDGNPVIIISLTEDAMARGLHAGHLAALAGKAMGGGGGGRANMAQAGGKHSLSAALELIRDTAMAQLGAA